MAADSSQSGGRPADGWWRWFAQRPQLTLALLVLAALAPFLSKPFNFDDPLFVWTARQIREHPANPYGFDVNWYWSPQPMWEVTQNPPLAAYYLALASVFLGWSETALHAAMLLPAVAAILGTHRLARRFCNQPMLAACATLFTPLFLVSSTTVMCDTLMLAFWVWAVVLWVEGAEDGAAWKPGVAAVFVALAALTKYFGVCLVPLLAVYSVLRHRRIGREAAWFLIPVAALAAYEETTRILYGRGLLSGAGAYATAYHSFFASSHPLTLLVALAFTGGGLAATALVLSLPGRARTAAAFLVGAGALTALVWLSGAMSATYGGFKGPARWLVAAQLVLWAAGGAGVLGMATADAWRRRDATSGLFVCWVLGTFAFAAFFNWIVNSRSLLPLVPAVGILFVRRMEQGGAAISGKRRMAVHAGLAGGAVLALWVARADFNLAVADRRSAVQTCLRYRQPGRTMWFEGHWGFQYYMQLCGAKPAAAGFMARPGDLLAVPIGNSDVTHPDATQARAAVNLLFPGPRRVSTMSHEVGAGFYASLWGPLPFAFGDVPPESVIVYILGASPPYKP